MLNGGILNIQIKQGLLPSLPVKKCLKSVNISHSYRQKMDCVVLFLPLLAMWQPIALYFNNYARDL